VAAKPVRRLKAKPVAKVVAAAKPLPKVAPPPPPPKVEAPRLKRAHESDDDESSDDGERAAPVESKRSGFLASFIPSMFKTS
jgi:hypothetical protein